MAIFGQKWSFFDAMREGRSRILDGRSRRTPYTTGHDLEQMSQIVDAIMRNLFKRTSDHTFKEVETFIDQ